MRVWYTHDTCMEPRWIGSGSEVDSPGFVALLRRPTAPPRLIPPHRTARNNAVLKFVRKKRVAEQVEANGVQAKGCIEWVEAAAKSGTIPVNEYIESDHHVPNGRFGTPAKIGVVGGLQVCVDILIGHGDGTSTADFWKATDVQSLPRTLAIGMRSIQPVLRYAVRRDQRLSVLTNSPGVGEAQRLLEIDQQDSPNDDDGSSVDGLDNQENYDGMRGRKRNMRNGGDACRYVSSDSGSCSTSTVATTRKRRKPQTPRGRKSLATKATRKAAKGLIAVGTQCYAVDKESKGGKWSCTKGKVQTRKGRGTNVVYHVWFNGFKEPFVYPRADIFSSKTAAKADCKRRDAQDLLDSSESSETDGSADKTGASESD